VPDLVCVVTIAPMAFQFRVVVLMNNLCFVDGVEIRIDNDDPKNRILIVLPSSSNAVPQSAALRFDLLRT